MFGSIAADNYFGRFRVILWVSVIYIIGHALLSFGAIPFLNYGTRSTFDFSGLILIALATGGIKPCVSAFAADQVFYKSYNDDREYFCIISSLKYLPKGQLIWFSWLIIKQIYDLK